jgi:hypothetical protein
MSLLNLPTILGVLGTQETILILVGIIIFVVIPVRFIYKYAKNKGRLQELEKRIKEEQQKK